ncbi:MAG: glucoamylase family protein [Candidatus Omnitrophota bacterium]|nr:glucoamylase family protein [Candidatus Omnitrophota bacterium]
MKIRILILTLAFVIASSCLLPAVDMERPKLPKDDEAFLEAIQRKAFDYFWKEVNPKTGIVYDGNTRRMGGSIASVGFALSAICVADSRGWVSREDAYNRVLTTIKSFHRNPDNPDDFCVDGYRGLFFHFIDAETGKWYKNADCVSTADTADLIAGIITCMEYFKGTEVEKIGDEIVRACEWDSFLKDNKGAAHKFITMGCVPPGMKSSWNKESGFFGRYYGYMDNSFLIYMLAIASSTHPIPVSSWYACQATYKRQAYNEKDVIVTTPPGLAFHYYHHFWLDLRNKKDQVADYFKNSLYAVVAQQKYCLTSENYKNGLWGLSSSLSPRGYEAMGAPFGDAYDNGTITPHAIAGGMPFTPKESLDALKYLAAYHGDMTMGKYGFTDAFNQKRAWSAREYLGINEGAIVLGIENFRSGLIWKYFMKNKYIQEAMKKIGFVGIIEDFENDPGKGAYSKYEVSGGNAVVKISTSLFMEGRRSLELDPMDSKIIRVRISPDLKDFSGFKYISLWARNSRDVKVCVTDKKNMSVTIDCNSYLDSALWRRYFFNLDRADGLDIDNISDVVVSIVTASDRVEDPVYLDGVELTYAMVNSNPPKPDSISLSAIDDASICEITFGALEGPHRYDLRYSTKPILSQTDFENCPPSDKVFFANDSDKETFFLPLPGSGRYYVGAQAIDNMGQRSKVESAGPVTVKAHEASKMLDDFERSGLNSNTIIYPARKGYTLSISLERVSRGKRALRAEFHKAPSDPWDYIELEFRKPLDVRPYRYLKIDAQGEDAIMAKLYNTKEMQEEIGVLRPLENGKWNELVFDIAAMPGDKIDKSRVTKLLLFIAPGRSASGTMYIDNIRLDN